MSENANRGDLLKSPLRYPGGKGSFYNYVLALIEKNNLIGSKYFEPYAGGAGVALALLSLNKVSQIFLNDADYHIYSFWRALLYENDRFIEKITKIKVTIKNWYLQKQIYTNPRIHKTFDVGFSTFFLNRCNRSGMLEAGPIGGYEQAGTWKINARFNKKILIERIMKIASMADKIIVKNMDGIVFMKKYLPMGHERKKVLVYADPPYVSAGSDLYLNYFTVKDHTKLANYFQRQLLLNWVVTYDNNLLIKQLYYTCQKLLFYLNYSLQTKRKGTELLILPSKVLPPRKNILKIDKCK